MTEQRTSFFHTLATVSLIAVPLAFVLGFFLNILSVSLDPAYRGIVGLVLGIVNGVIMLGGVIAGIVALFGIPRYGAKGILWKSLVGVLIPVLLTLLALPTILYAKRAATTINQKTLHSRLAELEAKLNKQCPVMVDEITRLDSVQIIDADSLGYNYTVTTVLKSEFPDGEFEKQMRPIILDAYRSSPEMEVFRKNRVTIVNRYKDKAGESMGEISAGPGDLKEQ